jgi:hypothetical protein
VPQLAGRQKALAQVCCGGGAIAYVLWIVPEPRPPMTDASDRPPNDPALARQSRLRDALRENLKRRKSQFRGRVDQARKVSEDGIDANPSPPYEQSDDPT